MLFRRVRRTTAATGVALTVTHALNCVPDFWNIHPVSDRSRGRTRVVINTALTNTVTIVNSNASNATVDVFVMTFKGELY
jgi:hypothetical protein